MMEPEVVAKIMDLAARVASRYVSRCRWAERAEIEAAAMAAMVEANSLYDDGRGVERGAFLWAVAVNAAHRSVLKASAPVSASHRPAVLKGMSGVSVFVEVGDTEVEREELSHDVATPEVLFDDAEVASRVRERVVQLLGADGAEFALGVISGDFKPREVAEYHRIPVERVYVTTRQMKATLSEDFELWKMWNEL